MKKILLLVTCHLSLVTAAFADDNALARDLFQMGANKGGKNIVVRAHDEGDGTWTPIIRLDPNVTIGEVTIGAALPAGTNILGKVGIDQTTDGTTNNVYARDAGAAWTTVRGVAGVPFTSADQHSAVASVTDAPTSGKKLVITDLEISTDTAMSVTFKCETTGAVVRGPIYMAANTTVNLVTRGKCTLATADKKLQVITSVAGNISVLPFYYSE